MRFMHILVIVALTLSTAGSVARADDKSHRAAVLELFELMGMEKMMQTMIEQMTAPMLKNAGQDAATMARIRPVVTNFFTKYMSWSALKDEYVDVYMKAFTEAEVHDVVNFYKTPTGRKMIAQLPALTQKGAQIGAARIQPHLPELYQELAKVAQPPAAK